MAVYLYYPLRVSNFVSFNACEVNRQSCRNDDRTERVVIKGARFEANPVIGSTFLLHFNFQQLQPRIKGKENKSPARKGTYYLPKQLNDMH
jgi:hypothetical protein